MTGCRIKSLTMAGARGLPFRLTAGCGWSCDVRQGLPWAAHPARTRWVGHTCRKAGR